MALINVNFTVNSGGENTISRDWVHSGVVGSGDMEVILSQKDLSGKVEVKVVTPVKGFDKIWGKIVTKFVTDNELGNLTIEINDNNATPYIVSMRLKQALAEAREVL